MLSAACTRSRAARALKPRMATPAATSHMRRRPGSPMTAMSVMAPMVQKRVRWPMAPNSTPMAKARASTSVVVCWNSASVMWRRTSGPDVGPALLLLAHDLDHAGRHVADVGQHVGVGELHGMHGVFASDDLDAMLQRLGDAMRDRGVAFQHRDGRPVDHDFEVAFVVGQLGLEVAHVVEREVPFSGVAVGDLEDNLVAAGRVGGGRMGAGQDGAGGG